MVGTGGQCSLIGPPAGSPSCRGTRGVCASRSTARSPSGAVQHASSVSTMSLIAQSMLWNEQIIIALIKYFKKYQN